MSKKAISPLNAISFETLFLKAEAAIELHPKLRGGVREIGGEWGCYPELRVGRLGWTFQMTVALEGPKGSRKRPTDITADGDTPEVAVQKLIASLDYWAEAMK